jgi:hypothetical protein
VGYSAGPNLYEYVVDDPVDRVDPTGLTDCVARPNGGQTCTIAESKQSNLAAGVASAVLAGGAAVWNAAVHTYEKATGQSDSAAGSKAATDADTKRQDPYVVRVQAQGSGLKQERSLTLQSDKPIPVKEVHMALTAMATGMSRQDQQATGTAFVSASKWATRVSEAGGIGPIGSQSFTNGVDRASTYRVDIEVLSGERNIVP